MRHAKAELNNSLLSVPNRTLKSYIAWCC